MLFKKVAKFKLKKVNAKSFFRLIEDKQTYNSNICGLWIKKRKKNL